MNNKENRESYGEIPFKKFGRLRLKIDMCLCFVVILQEEGGG